MAIVYPLLGGCLIGLAASVLLLTNGRIMGMSGILRNVFFDGPPWLSWQMSFLIGCLLGAFFIPFFGFSIASLEVDRHLFLVGLGGVLVGWGTAKSNGCTSGHGVCGVSRFSMRSITATLIFMSTAILTVLFLKIFGVGL